MSMQTTIPTHLGCQDKKKDFTFGQWKTSSARVANALSQMGCGQGERFTVLAFNRVEWMDMYAGSQRRASVVPLMFRLAGPEIEYITNDAERKAFIVEKSFVDMVDGVKDKLPIPERTIFLSVSRGTRSRTDMWDMRTGWPRRRPRNPK